MGPEQPAPTDHDYEDVTPLNSVADEVMLNTEYEDVTLLDSVVEESVVAPLEDKPQPAVPQPLGKTPEPVPELEAPAAIAQAEENVTVAEAAEIPEATKAVEEPERTEEVVENVEKEKANETVKEEKAEAKPEFARECIPPVRPQRSRTRPGARLSVPDWQPPKQTIFDYLISCFKPQAQ